MRYHSQQKSDNSPQYLLDLDNLPGYLLNGHSEDNLPGHVLNGPP